jgi:hypothetical protein
MEQVGFAADICTPSETTGVEQKAIEQTLGVSIPSCRTPPAMLPLPE